MKGLQHFIFEGKVDRMTDEEIQSAYDSLDKKDEVVITYESTYNGLTQNTFIVTKGKTVVGKYRVERISLVSKGNPKGLKYYLYNRRGITFAMGDMAATLLRIDKA